MRSAELVEDLDRRAAYQAVLDGEFAEGVRETITFCVYTVDLDEARGDVFVAVGLALALIERGYGIRIVPREQWHRMGPSDIVVGLLPGFDPALAGDAWKIAWVRNSTEAWAASPSLTAYDQVIASSRLSLERLRRAVPHADGVLPIGVDTELFRPPADESVRGGSAVTTANYWGSLRDVHTALMGLDDDADTVMFGMGENLPPLLARWQRKPISYFAVPAAYQRAAIVIDDMEPSTLGYGSANSRFFEASACGALVVTNGALGTAGLGIDGVPVYRGADDLGSLLASLRADPRALAEAARRVRDEIRRNHSWEVRAAAFDDLLAARRVAGRLHGKVRHAVHFYPDYRPTNPYQEMLYADLAAVEAFSVPVKDLTAHLQQRSQSSVPGTVHVHWTAPILQWAPGPYTAALALRDFEGALSAFKRAGGRLIWTVHNLLPHDGRFTWAERSIARTLGEESDLIHVLSSQTLEDAAELVELDPAKTVVIEHASYMGRYPDWISREDARARLGILSQEKVLVALGGVRPYKGLGRLLDVFEAMAKEDPSLRLLIAGNPAKQPGVPELVARCQASPRVISRFEFVPDDQLQVWMRAADLAVLPYHQILNSGAYLLAESFGLPIVAPRTGSIGESEGHPHVRLFDPDRDESLRTVLEAAVFDLVTDASRAEQARMSAIAKAESFTAIDMAREFAQAARPTLTASGSAAVS